MVKDGEAARGKKPGACASGSEAIFAPEDTERHGARASDDNRRAIRDKSFSSAGGCGSAVHQGKVKYDERERDFEGSLGGSLCGVRDLGPGPGQSPVDESTVAVAGDGHAAGHPGTDLDQE
jgi:hypothetical protein